MANENLEGLQVAILVDDGFEQVELTQPRAALDEAGATTKIVSPKDKNVRAWNFTDWGIELPVDVNLDQAKPQDFDALLLPGGVINPDSLRMQPKAVAFVKAFFDADKPVASICHGLGRSSRPAWCAGGALLPGHRSRPISRTPERNGWIRRSSLPAILLRAAAPMTSRRSIGRWSNYLAARAGRRGRRRDFLKRKRAEV